MIIPQVKQIPNRDIGEHCWRRISQFLNAEHTKRKIQILHELENKHAKNAERQASQIVYCLSQAKEYFAAAATVGLATKPVLLYYGVMSLALAEILLKQTGESRLEKLRESHNCHGLALAVAGNLEPEEPVEQAASNLVAKLQVDKSNNPRGTFEVWHRSAREYPIAGNFTAYSTFGFTRQFGALLTASDERLPTIPRLGVTLLDCFRELPWMMDTLQMMGIHSNLVHASVKIDQDQEGIQRLYLMVHPQPQHLIDEFENRVICTPDIINHVQVIEYAIGYSLEFQQISQGPKISLPHATSMNEEQVYFSCSDLKLNEFGYIYIALHICGNFARYYPDVWLKHVNKNSNLALAIEELCRHAVERLPLLALSELSRSYHVVTR